MQAVLNQLNALLTQTWFWVLVALVAMYFLTCYSRREMFYGGAINPKGGTTYHEKKQAGRVLRELQGEDNQ